MSICVAIRKNGEACKAYAMDDMKCCRAHANELQLLGKLERDTKALKLDMNKKKAPIKHKEYSSSDDSSEYSSSDDSSEYSSDDSSSDEE